MTRTTRELRMARASLALIGLGWVIPFLQPHHQYPLTTFYSEWLAFAIGLAATLLLLRKDLWREAAVPVIAVAPVGLMLVVNLQVMLGRVPYPEQAFTATVYLLWSTLLILLAHILKRELGITAIVRTIAWFVLVGGLGAAAIGVLQHYQISTKLDFLVAPKFSQAVYGNLLQSNHYANYLTLALASAAYLFSRGCLPAAVAGAYGALLLPMIALSGSRSPWIYLGVFALLAYLPYRRSRHVETRRLLAFTSCLLVGFAMAQWIVTLPFLLPPARHEGAVVTSAQRLFDLAASNSIRLQLLSEAWRMFLESPVLGAGFGQFAWHHFAWDPPAGTTSAPGMFNHAHNIVLQLMAETGVAGTLIFVGMVLYWLAGALRAARDCEWWWIVAGLAVIGIHSSLEYPLWYSYFLGPASILLGLGATAAFSVRKAGVARLTVAAAVVFGWLHVATIISPYSDFERVVMAVLTSGPPKDKQAFANTLREIHRETLLRPYLEFTVSFGIKVSPQSARESLILNDYVMHFAPTDAVVYRHALLLSLSGDHEAAMRQLAMAARAYPEKLAEFSGQITGLALLYPGQLDTLVEAVIAKKAEIRAVSAAQ